VQEQVATLVNKQVEEALASDVWLAPIEQKIIQYTQDHLLRKFSNSVVVPEIIDAVKQGVTELFVSGKIPNLQEFINPSTVESSVNQAVEQLLENSITKLTQNTTWLNRVEEKINQTVTYQTITKLGSIDINTIIRDRVDTNMDKFHSKMREDFSSVGIADQATQTQLTIMDDHTVFENNLTARDLTIANSAQIQNLVVTGSINTDNYAWDSLSADIAEKTFTRVTGAWQHDLVQQVADHIKTNGIDFDQVTIGGELLVSGDRLSTTIKETNIQSTGPLRSLQVLGGTSLNETLTVNRKRVGVNTEEPEMALSIWDEEVAINVGKLKEKTAYIGTSRTQGIAFGTNRTAHVEITADGLTQIKKLQVGLHRIGHDTQVPGYSGTKGDIVFNANPTTNVFAWVCLGAYKWQPLKSAE
jgi:hypothetical protein